jgi:YD repeat-containing protein
MWRANIRAVCNTPSTSAGLTNQYSYDSFGNVTQMLVLGNLTGEGVLNQTATNSATYTTNNLPSVLTDPVGNGMQYTYDSADPFKVDVSVRTSAGTPVATNNYFYTNVSQLSAIGTTNFAYGLLWRETVAGATNDSAYNGRGFKTQQIQYPATTDNPGDADPEVITLFSYNERGQCYQQQVVGGATVQMDYDPMGRMTSRQVFDQNNNNVSSEYFYFNSNGELEWYAGPHSNPNDYTYYIYDGAGREIQQIQWRSQGMLNGGGVQAPAGNALYATTFNTFDGFGNHTSSMDARGVLTTNFFDALGRVSQTEVFETNGSLLTSADFAYEPGDKVMFNTNALGGVTQTLYTQTGQPYFRQTPDLATNGWTYYLDGRPKRQYLANGSYWQTTYDDVNLFVTRTFYTAPGAALATNVAGFDRRGNQILKTDEAGNSFTSSYDGLNRVKSTARAGHCLFRSSRRAGRKSDRRPANKIIFYDAAGLAATNVNALGEKTITLFDVLGRVIDTEIHDAANNLVRITTTAYSPDHQSETVTQGSGSSAIVKTIYTDIAGKPVLYHLLSLSRHGRSFLDTYDLVRTLSPKRTTRHPVESCQQWTAANFALDGLNRVTSKTDRDGAVTTYAYDSAGNLTNQVMPGNTPVWCASYNSALQRQFDYDAGSGGGVTRSNYYTYNSTTGLLQTSTDGRGVTCTHTYDAFLRPITNAYSGSLPEQNLTDSWAYDPRGLVTNISESFASTNTGPSSSVIRTFDAYGQLQSDNVSAGNFQLPSGDEPRFRRKAGGSRFRRFRLQLLMAGGRSIGIIQRRLIHLRRRGAGFDAGVLPNGKFHHPTRRHRKATGGEHHRQWPISPQ